MSFMAGTGAQVRLERPGVGDFWPDSTKYSTPSSYEAKTIAVGVWR